MKKTFFYSRVSYAQVNEEVIADFPEIIEFANDRFSGTNHRLLDMHYNEGIEICLVVKGKYDWTVEGETYQVMPGDGFITCPWEKHGSKKQIIDWGEIYWLVICPGKITTEGDLCLAKWSGLSNNDQSKIGKQISCKRTPILSSAVGLRKMFEDLNRELIDKSFAYQTRVHALLDEILIYVSRKIESIQDKTETSSEIINKLELLLKSDLTKKWSIEEMVTHFSVGRTIFNNTVKQITGFPPLSYLIHLRVETAKEMLLNTDKSLTEIALDCGFYSSQHFSATFANRVGCTPSMFRKSNKNG
jgi:AraC-like DNA-binding protein